MPYNWTCPHCSRPQIVTENNEHRTIDYLRVTDLDIGDVAIVTTSIGCLNNDCKKLSLVAALRTWETRHKPGPERLGKVLNTWRLMPESNAVPQPDYIPVPLREDYYEACKIRELSAKASATLARRCLQGMIRDFCGISRGTLDSEIKELKSKVEQRKAPAGVTPESVDAID